MPGPCLGGRTAPAAPGRCSVGAATFGCCCIPSTSTTAPAAPAPPAAEHPTPPDTHTHPRPSSRLQRARCSLHPGSRSTPEQPRGSGSTPHRGSTRAHSTPLERRCALVRVMLCAVSYRRLFHSSGGNLVPVISKKKNHLIVRRRVQQRASKQIQQTEPKSEQTDLERERERERLSRRHRWLRPQPQRHQPDPLLERFDGQLSLKWQSAPQCLRRVRSRAKSGVCASFKSLNGRCIERIVAGLTLLPTARSTPCLRSEAHCFFKMSASAAALDEAADDEEAAEVSAQPARS